jgi:hypothetical protein
MSKDKNNHTTKTAATVAASVVMHRIMDVLPNIIQNAVEHVSNSPSEQLKQEQHDYVLGVNAEREIRRAEIRPIPDLPNPIMQSAKWRASQGERIGFTWLVREEMLHQAEQADKILVEQYGANCSMLYKSSKSRAKEIAPGVRQIFRKFAVLPGNLDDIVADMAKEGWSIKHPPSGVQQKLVEGGVS